MDGGVDVWLGLSTVDDHRWQTVDRSVEIDEKSVKIFPAACGGV